MELKINVEEKDGKVIISGNEMFADFVKILCAADEQGKKYKKWHEEYGDDDDPFVDEIMEELDKLDEQKEILNKEIK